MQWRAPNECVEGSFQVVYRIVGCIAVLWSSFFTLTCAKIHAFVLRVGDLLDVCQSNWLKSFDLKDIAVLNYQKDFSKERRGLGKLWAACTKTVTKQRPNSLCLSFAKSCLITLHKYPFLTCSCQVPWKDDKNVFIVFLSHLIAEQLLQLLEG